MQFDTVESCRHRVLRGLGIFRYGGLDVGFGHRLRRGILLHAFCIGVHVADGGHCRRSEHPCTFREIKRVTDTTTMHELDEHFRTLGMHRIGDQFPACDLLGGKYPRDTRVA